MVRDYILERSKEISKTPMLQRIANVKEELKKAGDEAQELRHMPAWGNKIMVDTGLYRHTLPKELGGEDFLSRGQIETIEAAAAIDGSVGWLVQINSEINALVLRQMDTKFAHQVMDDWHVVVSSGLGTPNGPFPGRRGRREGTGWRIDYQGAFASGCMNATWNMILQPAGEMVDLDTGKPLEASFMIPKGEFEVVDTWYMAGLRGSGSHDVRVTNGYVPPEHLLPMNALASTKTWENPVHRNPNQVPFNKAAVALGIARGAIDDLVELAMTKTPWMSGTMLKDQPEMWIRLGEAEANWAAARAFVLEANEEIEADLGPLKGGKEVPDWPLIRKGLLSSTHAAQACRQIVDSIHSTSGTTGMREGNPLERRLRDAHQAAAHGGVSWRHYSNLAKTWLGVAPPPQYANVTRA